MDINVTPQQRSPGMNLLQERLASVIWRESQMVTNTRRSWFDLREWEQNRYRDIAAKVLAEIDRAREVGVA